MISLHFRPLPGIAACAALALAFAGCSRSPEPTRERTVAIARAVRTRLTNSLTLQGEFTPFQDVMLHAKVAGYVNPIRVDIGDHVKEGDLVAVIEVPELHSQLEGALATEQKAAAEHEAARLDFTRLSAVNGEHPDLVAQQELDNARARDASTAAAAAAAHAEAQRLRALESYTRVVAPFSGIITKRFVDNGALVGAGTSSGSGPLVELAQDSVLRLRFPVPESVSPLIRDGTAIRVTVDSAGKSFATTVARDAWQVEPSTRTMVAEADVSNPAGALKAGMYATVVLDTQVVPDAITVPLQALPASDNPTLLVVGADGAVSERRVTVGMRTASFAQVTSGLSPGETVVLGDRSGIELGSHVQVREVAAGSEQ
jgi:RND family efflux transporter MFP subunit